MVPEEKKGKVKWEKRGRIWRLRGERGSATGLSVEEGTDSVLKEEGEVRRGEEKRRNCG